MGNEPVREWLRQLPENERFHIGDDIKRVQYCWPLGLPLVRPMGDGLFEVRSRLPLRDARTFFYFNAGRIVILHAFIKKTPATPDRDLNLARWRLSDHLQHHEKEPP